MQRVLITGADGFTGRYLAPAMALRGYEVHGMVATAPAGGVDGVHRLHAADLTDRAAVAAVVDEASPTHIVHLAAIAFVHGEADPMYQVNLLGTRHLLQALAALESPPVSVLLASSANVYGNSDRTTLDETAPPQPANDYAVSKLAMEYLASLYMPRLPIVICRPFNYTGVGQSDMFLIAKIVAHVTSGNDYLALGNLDVARDFSDVRHVVSVYAELLGLPHAAGQTLNVCSGIAHTLREILGRVEALTGKSIDVRIDPRFVRANEVRLLRGDRSRLDSLLPRPLPPIPLESTLSWMLESSAAPVR